MFSKWDKVVVIKDVPGYFTVKLAKKFIFTHLNQTAMQVNRFASVNRPYNIINIGKPQTMSLTQTQVTSTEAKANLDELCEQVINDRDTIIITRKNGENKEINIA